MNRGINAYNTVAVHTGVSEASPHRLIQMLLDAALEKIMSAKGFMSNGKVSAKGEQIGLAVSIIDALRASLDKEKGGDIALNLERLYEYSIERLTEANLQNDLSKLDEVVAVLKPIKEAWDAIPLEVQQEHELMQQREQTAG